MNNQSEIEAICQKIGQMKKIALELNQNIMVSNKMADMKTNDTDRYLNTIH